MRLYSAEMLFNEPRGLEEQCMPNLETITFCVGVFSATIRRDLIGLATLSGMLSDSDFVDLTLFAGRPSGIVGILGFEHSIQNASVDGTLQGYSWLVDKLIHDSSQSLHTGNAIAA